MKKIKLFGQLIVMGILMGALSFSAYAHQFGSTYNEGEIPSRAIRNNTDEFDDKLSSNDDTAQKAFETLDEHDHLEEFSHADADDMPDTGGTVSDHDVRYYTKDEVNEIVEGAVFEYFLNDTLSGIGSPEYRTMDPTETGDVESDFADTITDDAFLIDSFITVAPEPTFVNLMSGIYSFHLHAETTTGVGVKTTRLFWELYKRLASDPFTETLLLTSEESTILTNSDTEYDIHGTLSTDVVLGDTDLLVLKVYANIEDGDPPRNTDPLVTFHAEGTTATHLEVRTTIGAFDDRYVFVAGDTSTGKQAIRVTSQQLELEHDASNQADFTVGSGGDLTLTTSGGDISFGDENLSTTGDFTCEDLTLNGLWTWTGSTEAVWDDAIKQIQIKDDESDALNINTGSSASAVYLSLRTTNGNESIFFGNATQMTTYSFAGGQVSTAGDLVCSKEITVNEGNNAEDYLILKGSGITSQRRGGGIEWMHDAADNVTGYNYTNSANRFVWDNVKQASVSDTGVAYVDFDDGNASFSGGTVTTAPTVVTIKNSGAAQAHLKIEGSGVASPRGGYIILERAGDGGNSYIFVNEDGDFVFDNNVQGSDGDLGKASIDTSDGSAKFSNQKFKITPLGGIAILLTNREGSTLVSGDIVEADTNNADSCVKAGANSTKAIGVVELNIVDDQAGYIVVSGVADVMGDAAGWGLGDRIIAGGTAGAGTAENSPTAGEHLQEIGHAIEANGGSVLARVVIHFN